MPETLKKLIETIAYLPGVGEKTATKLAFFLLKANSTYIKNFATHLERLQSDIHECARCFSLTDSNREFCTICSDPARETRSLCVVEDYLDMISIDKLHIYKGLYHVLGGAISPVNGMMPDDLKMKELFKRIADEPIEEIIIATNPNIEGEATALYIKENLSNKNIKITRLSKGLPNAGYIEYADEITLINAFKGRS